MRLVSYSHSSGTAPRSSAASSVRSSVLSITQNPDDELTAASNHDDLDDIPYEYEGGGGVGGDGDEEEEDVDCEYDEEAAGRTTDNSQRRTFGDGGGGGGRDGDEMDSDLDDIDVDLDEDVVWEEIRRRVGELRTAYQHILHNAAAAAMSSPAASR